VTPLQSYARTALCCLIEKAQNSAHENIRDMNRDLLDWTPACGIDDLVSKIEALKAEADLLLFRVRPLVEE
jgi:hypothetical protein